MARLGSVEELHEPWRKEVRPALRRACLGAGGAACMLAVLLARVGTLGARVGALFVILAGLAPLVVAEFAERRRAADPRRGVRATVLRTEPDLGHAVLRALTTVDRTAARADTGSPELAELHVARLLGRVDLERLARRAGREAWLYATGGALLAALGFGLAVWDPARVVEGLDVLAARRGVAPVPLAWLDGAVVVAEPPAFLGASPSVVDPSAPLELDVGTVVTVRAIARRQGRALVLGDAGREVPFERDAEGAWVARWVVDEPASLRVSARFGHVRIPESSGLEVVPIPDREPVVTLEGAPTTLKLLENPRIAVHWEARDDHALREVALVLRSGEREERRPLSKPQGSSDRGGIDLLARDPFIAKSFVPIEVTVEALDNDAIHGPKWGKSASIVLVPPQVAELEALRHRALREARDVVTDLLATRVLPEVSPTRAWVGEQAPKQREAVLAVLDALRKDFGGLRIPGRVSAAARGQLERLDAAWKALERAPAKRSLAKLVEATESTLLGLDALLEALGDRDTRAAARKLAEVADEAAAAIKLGREPEERARAERRLTAALGILEGGGKNLIELGRLGLDLGEIVESDLARIARATKDQDRHHARLAALDLANRLRHPDPSFSSSGSGSMGGIESGASGEGVPPSDAAAEAESLENALEELRRDHASEVAEVERALDDTVSEDEKKARRDELRKLAEGVRNATKNLPEQGAEPSSARSEAAQARSQAEGMAAALERGDLGAASENGKRAVEALERAARRGADAPRGSREHDVAGSARSASASMKRLLQEADKALADSRKRASEAARSVLEKAAQREKSLAERARQLRERSESSEAPLPEEMMQKLDDAARKMESAAREFQGRRGAKGLDAQREAQRLLEMAQPEKEQEGDGKGKSGDGHELDQNADVPGEHPDESAERFRRRVTEGLGKRSPGRLRDSVRRYTEGLLR
jgi:hypothetical protein